MHTSIETRGRERRTLRTLWPTLLLLGGSPALADSAAPFELVVQAESSQGKRLVRGYYDQAAVVDARTDTESFEALNNRCVMNIVSGAFAKAKTACDGAVNTIDLDRLGMSYPRYPVDYTPLAEERKAMALINRGVLRAMTADVQGARNDFERAMELGPQIEAGEANLALLDARAEASPEFASLSK